MSQDPCLGEEATLLAPEILSRLVGVIDLRGGQAVHAIAGCRESYRAVQVSNTVLPPVRFPTQKHHGDAGDPLQLALGYHALGIRQLYIADLDAIESGQVQSSVMRTLFRQLDNLGVTFSQWLIDLGWTGSRDAITWLTDTQPSHVDVASILWVVPTESAPTIDALALASQAVSPRQVVLGLDYRQGRLISRAEPEDTWIAAVHDFGLGGILVLDLVDVGTASGGSSASICRRVKARAPNVPIYSGGGIRSADDARQLLATGCDHCLVATALHGLIRAKR